MFVLLYFNKIKDEYTRYTKIRNTQNRGFIQSIYGNRKKRDGNAIAL
jgi:hypothetical protein